MVQRLPAAKREDPSGAVETAIHPLSRAELRSLFPAAEVRVRSGGLHLGIAGLLSRSPLVAEVASRMPLAHTHLLAEVGKP